MNSTRWLVLACMILVGAGAASAAPLADKVPADAVVYVGWAGRTEALDDTLPGLIARGPMVEALLAGLKTKFTEGARDESRQQFFDNLWKMAEIAVRRPCALALYDVAMPAPPGPAVDEAADVQPQPRRPSFPMPIAALLVDLGPDRAQFAQAYKAMVQSIPRDSGVAGKILGTDTYYRLDTPIGPAGMGMIDAYFFISLGDQTPSRVLALVQGKEPTLAAAASFAASAKILQGDNLQLSYYVDAARATALARKLQGSAPAGAEDPVSQMLKMTGLGDVVSITGGTWVVKKGFLDRVVIRTRGPRGGMLGAAAVQPLPADALDAMPADAIFAAVVRRDAGAEFAELKKTIGGAQPEAAQQIDKVLEGFRDATGVDLEKDLLAHMGDHWSITSAPSLGGILTGTVLSVSLKDAQAFTAALVKAEQQAAVPGKLPVQPSIKTIQAGGAEIHYLAGAGEGTPVPVAVAWTVHNGRLVVGAYPQVVIGALQAPRSKLADSPAFREAVGVLGPNRTGLIYVNTPQLARAFYGVALAGWSTACGPLSKELGGEFTPAMLPALTQLEPYLKPTLMAFGADATTMTIEAYGSLPGGPFLQGGPGALGLAASVLMPTVGRSMEMARRSISGANLSSIGKFTMIYQAEHEKLPPDLQTLVKSGLSAEALYSPHSDNKPRYDAGGQLVGEFDYVYLGGQFGDKDPPPDMIIAYEKPELNKFQGTNVLQYQGSVKWMDMETFRRELARVEKFIRTKDAW